MQPTFNGRGEHTCDAVLLNKLSVLLSHYGRGDVVVLRAPHEPKEMLTKRIIGMEGDVVARRGRSGELVHVPRGHIWVEGDNEASSNDSNGFGCVSAALIEARVCFKLWPLSEAGSVLRVEPTRDRLLHRGSCQHMERCVAEGKGVMPWHVK